MEKGKLITTEIAKEYIESFGYKVISGEYINVWAPFECRDSDGYKYMIRIATLKKGSAPSKFHVHNVFTIFNINLWLEKNNKSIRAKEDQEYIRKKYKMFFICNECGSEFDMPFDSVYYGCGCPYCSLNPQRINETNCLKAKRPDLIKYLKNKEDSDKVLSSSTQLVNLACPDCGFEKTTSMNFLSSHGFSCPICSDGISIPEKFVGNILNQLKISFKKEASFNWSNKKRYDFYVKEINMIIETHGRQHYDKSFHYTNEEEEVLKTKINDYNKKTYALSNGILHYIVIDCKFSDYEYLKNNVLKSLMDYFDFKDVNFTSAWEMSQKSLLKQVWDYKNENNSTIKEICENFGLSDVTVKRYIKVYSDIITNVMNKNEYITI